MEKKFEETLEKCVGIMNDCGFTLPNIEFKLNGRFTSTLGKCTKLIDKEYMIEISKRYAQGCIETGNIRRLEQTILHEMAHTLPNGYNHGEIWKSYADIINTKFGYEISRLVTVPNEIKRYWIKDGVMVCCDDCGKERLTKRSSNVVQEVEYYRCGCGGKLKIKEVI